jgi:ADP-heptose:LPS heptosyltransferase
MSRPERVLFVTSTRIGDAILSTGLLSHLLETRPEARFTIACGPVAAPLFESVPRLDRLIVMTKGPLAAHWRRLWAGTAATRWDLVVDLRSSGLAYLLRARERRVLMKGDEDRHRVARLGRLLGLDPPPAPRVWISEEAEAQADSVVGRPDRLLAVGPTANWIGKQWPAERFADLVGRLRAPGAPFEGAPVMVLGGPGEREAADPVIRALAAHDLVDLVGTAGLSVAAACLRRAHFYIGNDSGLMHLAAAAGVPTLGLFGPSRDLHYAPWGPVTAVVRAQTWEEIVQDRAFDHRAPVSYMLPLDVDRVERAALDLWSRCSQARKEP